jgi:hypothetical protein
MKPESRIATLVMGELERRGGVLGKTWSPAGSWWRNQRLGPGQSSRQLLFCWGREMVVLERAKK